MTRIEPKADVLLEDGWYPAIIRDVEDKDTEYGERLMVPFDVKPGDGTTVDVTTFISFSDHPKSNMVRWAKGLFGERPFDTDEFSGAECEVFIEESENKKGEPTNYIRKVRRPKEEKVEGRKKPEVAAEGEAANDEDFSNLPF